MNNNVFQSHGENADLGEHINKTFEYPQDVASMCKSFNHSHHPQTFQKEYMKKMWAKR